MSVRINLEIGHEAAIRTKRTQEGFTHDWEVFVRGCDGANISYYVEKVVFYLHETFPKPKRVVKEPPYSVKESGYAGFTLPIEIHLRNKDDPKKITFHYDLNLQQTGPAIIKVQKEKYVLNSPGDDFRLKLLKGGGSIVNSSQEISRESRPVSEEKSQLVSKPRLGGPDFIKKHKQKIEEPRNSNSFQDLFGPPITKTSKVSLDPKPVSKDKNSNINKSGSNEKEKSKSKHSPHKEKDKEKEKFREKGDSEKKSKDDKKREEKKDRSKDREERIKEKKERRDKSPKVRSPTPTKRPSSPKRPPSPLPKYKEKEEKKAETPKEKKSSDDKDKLEKKAKKEKREKEKEKKESKHKDKDSQKSNSEQKDNKNINREKEKHKESVREKEPSPLPPPKSEKKEKSLKEKEIIKDYIKETKELEHIDKNGKIKMDKLEEPKPKHKHKKKDKDKREKDKLNEKEKVHKSEKKSDKSILSTGSKYIESNKETQKEIEKVSLFNSPKHTPPVENKIIEKPKKPLNALLAEFVDSDTSNSSISSHEDMFVEPIPIPIPKVEPKKETLFESIPPKPEPEKTKVKKEKTKKNKDKKAEKDMEKKRKRKSENNRIEEPLEKIPKEDSSNSNLKDSDTELNAMQTEVQAESEENYEDYMNILRDLQHKILTLQDNTELQKVVQLIAETGRFEVSAQTFDFDLCLLERSTITQLQNFFESTS